MKISIEESVMERWPFLFITQVRTPRGSSVYITMVLSGVTF